VPANTRLGIPALYLADSPVGVGNGSTGVTQWADTSALASTWDTSLASAYGSAYGAEQAGKGHNIALMPTVNILRLPLWGRAPETFSEDPYLTGRQAVAEIRGVQSRHVMATVKHLVANNQEVLRSHINPNPIDKIWPSFFASKLKAAVLNGSVPESTLDTMVTHILTAMFRIGLFDHPLPNPAAVKNADVSTPAHLALSTKIATNGTVLLENARTLLPLSTRSVRSIAVIGDAASEHPQTAAGGSATVLPSQPVVTPLAGITARAGAGVRVTHARGTLGVAGPLPAVPASAFGSGLTVTYYASADLSGTPIAT